MRSFLSKHSNKTQDDEIFGKRRPHTVVAKHIRAQDFGLENLKGRVQKA
jgi:hypothetical protein